MHTLTDNQYIKLQNKWAYWNKQFHNIHKKDVDGKRRRKIVFNAQVYDLACELADGIKPVKREVSIPEEFILDEKTIENGKKWQQMVANEASLVLNNL